jgi:acyl carrier protein
MNHSGTFSIIYKTLTKELGIKKELIKNAAIFSNDFGLNDTELSILLFYVENHYNIDIPQNAITLQSSIYDLEAAIQKTKKYDNAVLSA